MVAFFQHMHFTFEEKSENNKYFLKITVSMELYHIGFCGIHLVANLTDEN